MCVGLGGGGEGTKYLVNTLVVVSVSFSVPRSAAAQQRASLQSGCKHTLLTQSSAYTAFIQACGRKSSLFVSQWQRMLCRDDEMGGKHP